MASIDISATLAGAPHRGAGATLAIYQCDNAKKALFSVSRDGIDFAVRWRKRANREPRPGTGECRQCIVPARCGCGPM